jgi:ABC-type sugar transport system ATPase subunit
MMTDSVHVNQNLKSSSPDYAIELVAVTKKYGNLEALKNINLDIEPGEFLVLLGPSGCGKSTILKIISGLEDATDGEVYINGNLVNYVAPKQRDVAMVFQNYALYPHMTVERNIGFPLKMQRVQKDEIKKKVLEVAQLLEVEDLLEKYPEQLSGGQRQRVALGRALIRDPIAFLLDEPLSNLDALLRVQMRDELLNLHRRIGRTNVYVTHDQVEAMTMADRIVVLKLGEIQQIGKPRDVYKYPANTFVATFVGSPQMNIYEGSVNSRNGSTEFIGPFTLSLGERFAQWGEGEKAYLGIRPEDISLDTENDGGSIPGKISLIEPIGADTFINVEIEDSISIKIRVSGTLQLNEGQSVYMKIDPKYIHMFDSHGDRVN